MFLHLFASCKYSVNSISPSTWQKLRWGRSLKTAAQSRGRVFSLCKEVLFSLYCQFQQQSHCAPSQLFLIHWFRLQSLSQAFSLSSYTYWQRRTRSFQTAHLALFSSTVQCHICPLRPLLLNFPVVVCNFKMLWTDFNEDENCNLKPNYFLYKYYFFNIQSLLMNLFHWGIFVLSSNTPATVLAALVVAVVYPWMFFVAYSGMMYFCSITVLSCLWVTSWLPRDFKAHSCLVSSHSKSQ